mmetsp:Transcript_131716/g.380947  ORF Transcript_131716/g.380947 Transcript_131716/m.380947 type:complete len:113 (+) Transcript_131716:190-528(+)
MLWNSIQLLPSLIRHRLSTKFRQAPLFTPQLAGVPQHLLGPVAAGNESPLENSWIWFAVPKRKHTPSRKRMKTTVHKKLPLKKNIAFDPRTGEVSLKHKMPFNWKDYLPKDD